MNYRGVTERKVSIGTSSVCTLQPRFSCPIRAICTNKKPGDNSRMFLRAPIATRGGPRNQLLMHKHCLPPGIDDTPTLIISSDRPDQVNVRARCKQKQQRAHLERHWMRMKSIFPRTITAKSIKGDEASAALKINKTCADCNPTPPRAKQNRTHFLSDEHGSGLEKFGFCTCAEISTHEMSVF